MSSDSEYRDYSQEILQRPLPVIETPHTEGHSTRSKSESAFLNVEVQPRRMSETVRREQWKANVNSAISGNRTFANTKQFNTCNQVYYRLLALALTKVYKINLTRMSSLRLNMTQSSKFVIRFSSWPNTRISLTAL